MMEQRWLLDNSGNAKFKLALNALVNQVIVIV
jgi:hypothetical protein